MKKPELHPYANYSECLEFGGLTVENRTDRISIFGSIDLTLDKVGLGHARRLKAILDVTIARMEDESDLPEKIIIVESDTVDNPFA